MEIVDAIDLYNQYLLVEKGLSINTSESYLDDLKRFFMFFPDKKDTNDLSPYDLASFLEHEIKIGRKASSAFPSSKKSNCCFVNVFTRHHSPAFS